MNKIEKELPGVRKNFPLKDCTTYKIGGPAKYFFSAGSKEDLAKALRTAEENKLPVFILGGGSNLLVSDKGFKGLVIKPNIQNIEFADDLAKVGAGVNLTKLVYLAAEKGLSGLEWAVGIPSATVGGAVYGSAQAFGTKISELIKGVDAIDIKTLKIKKFSKAQCKFSLKNSIFKKNKRFIIVSALLKFRKKDPAEIKDQIEKFLEYRRSRHPVNFPSAGSTFVNPEGGVPAGVLIEKCGLKGKRIGNAQISEQHCNFIINLGGAKSKDVMALIKLSQMKVKKTFGIELEPEVQFVGF